MIIVPTCNTHYTLVKPFSVFVNKYWPRQDVVVLCYDNVPKYMPRNFRVVSLGRQDDFVGWADGVIRFVKTIKDDRFILMLEDYFLYEPVKVDIVARVDTYMGTHPDIGKCDLTDDRNIWRSDKPAPVFDEIFIPTKFLGAFASSVQAAMWDKRFFLELAEPTDSIWTFERESNTRFQELQPDYKWSIIGTNQCPVKYLQAHFIGSPMTELYMGLHSGKDVMTAKKLMGVPIPISASPPVHPAPSPQPQSSQSQDNRRRTWRQP